MNEAVCEAMARAIDHGVFSLPHINLYKADYEDVYIRARAALNMLAIHGYVMAPKEPTEAMLNAARDWSAAIFGKPIGNDAANGCWQAMLAAAQI